MRILIRWALALAPAAMLGAYASYPMLAFLPWIALVPWVVLYTDERKGPVSSLYYFLGAFVTWILQYPQAWRFGWYAPIVMGLACLPWWLPFAPVLSRLHGNLRVPRPLAVALAWTSVEWLRSTFTVSHFDLYGIGYSQARFPVLVQFADVTGSYGVSFLVAAVNGWLAEWILTARESGWLGAFRRPGLRWGAVGIGIALISVSGYGAWRVASIRHEPGPRLALVQPALPHSPDNMIDTHLSQLLMTRRQVPPGEVDLIVWPENAILDDIRREGAYLEDLASVARDKGAWFVVGAQSNRADLPGRTTNGAWLVDTAGEIRGAYQKQILFPWSEYIPADEFLGRWIPQVQRLHRWITRLGWGHQPTGTAGDRMEILEFPWRGGTSRFAALICVENTYPPLPAAAGRLGADFFLNITSEGLVGGPVQEQLLRIAMFRAIENRMSYVRVGNTGISGVIDAVGRVKAVLRGDNGNTIATPGVLLADVPVSHGPKTVYSRSHDLFVRLIVGATALLTIASFARRLRSAFVCLPLAAALLATGCASDPSIDGRPEAVGENLARGRSLLAAAKPGEAIEALASACATESGCREAIPVLFEAYARGKADDEAAATFGRIADRHAALRADALASRAYFLERIHEWTLARNTYAASLAAGPRVEVHERLGNLLVRMERYDEAIEAFRAGLRIDPGNAPLRYALGRALRLHGDLEQAERILAELVGEHPDHGYGWSQLGWTRLEHGDDRGAEEALRNALRVEPPPVEAGYLMAKVALRRNDSNSLESIIREIRAMGRNRRR